ncbi:head maturation protease, ClpP-related [Evansella cellulosilytica]|uniref:ATP-dependent Clp protease proteolytic subunit n=1 Tax=Evansella cellulosilytica (strain ATCC 21833 / DSM 2522 / FERM P-1141 / JCM 9156 / N-4) TaxID=649639 RepID=E6U1J5_EVAC2|nr:head maturation protease, ClpP-related [Evansella cellulosilytica]ADU30358.1 peptidase S14 ClpP [Evansella cellulosilytica DSM 2522]
MKWMKIKNETNESVDFYIYGDIVSDTDWKWDDSDVMPKEIRELLDNHVGKKINLYVNSGGGSVFSGLSMLNMLKRAREKGSYITAYVDGLAGSIASVLIFGANKIYCPSNSYIMIHRAWTGMYGNATDFLKMAEDLEKIDEGILNTYKDNLREGVDIETIKEMVDKETWLTGEDASKYFNIEVVEENKAVACASDYFKEYKNMPNEVLENVQTPEKVLDSKNKQNDEEVQIQIEALKLELELI